MKTVVIEPSQREPYVGVGRRPQGAAASELPEATILVKGLIGSLIREACNLSDIQIEQILSYQREHGTKFGDAAIALDLASEDDVMWALSQQFNFSYLSAESSPFGPELVVATDTFSPQAEVFREFRSELLAGVLADKQSRRPLAVVSLESGEGKSYFTANLAIALSQLGANTLIIDADMRTPRQHHLFKLGTSNGLSNILAGRSEIDVVKRVEGLPCLFVLPAGTMPPNPTDLLQRDVFSRMLQDLRGSFDYIIVDTPASTLGADSRMIASKCGAALMLGRRHVSRIPAMQSYLDALARSQTRLAGVLINEF